RNTRQRSIPVISSQSPRSYATSSVPRPSRSSPTASGSSTRRRLTGWSASFPPSRTSPRRKRRSRSKPTSLRVRAVLRVPPRIPTSRKRRKEFSQNKGPGKRRALFVSGARSLDDDLHALSKFEFGVALEPVQNEEAIELVIRHRHPLGEFLHRVAEA